MSGQQKMLSENEVLDYWNEISAFETSLELSQEDPPFVFFDGPPFATGTPHYGHLVASTIKDIFGRYKTMTGFHVPRQWAWDCVAEGTLINLADGTSIPIEKFRNLGEYKTKVQTYDSKQNGIINADCAKFFDQKQRECIKLIFEDNTELICTPDHKIMTINGYVEAQNLKPAEDFVITCSQLPSKILEDNFTSNWELITGELHLKYITFEDKLRSGAFSRLLGYMLADGTLFYNTSKNTMVSYIYLGHEFDAIQYAKDVEIVCGLLPKYKLTRNVYVLGLPTKLVKAFQSLDGVINGSRMTQPAKLPNFLNDDNCPKYIKQEFLGGLMGGDGHTVFLTSKRLKMAFGYVRFSQSKNVEHMNSLQLMFQNIIKLFNDIGINDISILTSRETTNSKKNLNIDKIEKKELSMSFKKDSMLKFAKNVGFRYCVHKTARLNACTSYLSMRSSTHTFYYLKEWLITTQFDKIFQSKYAITRNDTTFPTTIIRLKKTEYVGLKNVYDICVPDTSNFIANGIVVHNCHGLPIEFKIDERLNIKTTQQVLDYGIDKYNAECRSIVMQYRNEWRSTINRLGRWVDMDNDIRTMDPEYMESVWWGFNEMFRKGLVYRGYKVVPYSMACATPLSNFESKSCYKDTSDWSITVKFQLVNSHTQVLVWTTTPWTLPSNLMLAVHPDLDYCTVEVLNPDGISVSSYLVAKCRIQDVFGKKTQITIVNTVKGTELAGLKYNPLFDYYKERKGFYITCADWVQSDSGTGIVHCAPAYGAEDYKACLDAGVITKTELPLCPIDANGNYVEPVKEWLGINVKTAESSIVEHLSHAKLVFNKGKIVHSYPFCWRSNTPLIYKVCECWFINVSSIKEQLTASTKETYWVPENIRDNRFANWLENAEDWCVSRNRFWGTPIPLWVNDDFTEVVSIGSTWELEMKAGLPSGSIKDLHREFIDHITIPSVFTPGSVLRRVPYVFDCWYESGSLPFASVGHPRNRIPLQTADFIAEGLDQTRGWFYTLTVIGTALFGESPFKNVIVNGIVLNEKGEKMSKNLGNYPPVSGVLDQFGADALRLYLIDTPVVKAGDIKFKESDIEMIVRKYHCMVQNVAKFYGEMVDLYNQAQQSSMTPQFSQFSLNSISSLDKSKLTVLDNWILQCLNDCTTNVHIQMNIYKLNGIVGKLFTFIDQLSRWYMNLNKDRFKKCDPMCLQILGNCLYYFSLISAPFAPFMAESIYHFLIKVSNSHFASSSGYDARKMSIHFHKIPTEPLWVSDGNLLETFDYFSELIDLTRIVRAKRFHADGTSASSIKLAFPKITIISRQQPILNQLNAVLDYIQKELNVIQVDFSNVITSDYISFTLQPNIAVIKLRLTDGKTIGKIMKYFKQLTPDQIDKIAFNQEDCAIDSDTIVYYNELIVNRVPKNDNIVCSNNLTVLYDSSITPEILEKYYCKMFYRGYQDTRKRAGLVQTDTVQLEYICSDEFEIILQKYLRSLNNVAIRVSEFTNHVNDDNAKANVVLKERLNLKVTNIGELVNIGNEVEQITTVDVSMEKVKMSLVKFL
jgi:isoleucyl-tRNA synthetase